MSAILLLGGNKGGVEAVGERLDQAIKLIDQRVGTVVKRSSGRVSEAWGFESEDLFVNVAVEVESSLEPERMLDEIQAIEQELGRDREAESREKLESSQRYVSRSIDIDIILYDDMEYSSPRLTIPHPLMMEREFVLEPMRELGIEI